MSAVPAATTTLMVTVAETAASDSATLTVTVAPSAAPTPIVASGSAQVLPSAYGFATYAPLKGEIGLSINSGGTAVPVRFRTDEQEKRHLDLHEDLTTEHPNARINVTRGYLEENGQIVKYLDQDPRSAEGQMLIDMRRLFHDALGQQYSDLNWPTFTPGDRAATNDKMPYKRENSAALNKIQVSANDVPKEQQKEFHTSKKLQKGIVSILDKQIDKIGSRIGLHIQMRKTQLTHVKEKFEKLDEMMIGFHAAYPPPNLSGMDKKAQIEAIQKYKKQAKEYLNTAIEKNQAAKNIVKRTVTDEKSEKDLPSSINTLANELALMACHTREDYDFGCLVLETDPCKTSPEMFIMRLSALVANGATGLNIKNYMTDGFPIAFSGLTELDDQGDIESNINRLIEQIRKELDDSELAGIAGTTDAEYATAFSRRIEQLDMVNKQNEIIKALKGISTHLTKTRIDLSDVISELDALAEDLDTIAERLKVPSELDDTTYKESADQILGEDRTLRSRNAEGSIIKRLQNQVQALTDQADRKELGGIINKLNSIIKSQTELGTYFHEKVHKSLNPFHKKINLDQIAAVAG